MSKAQSAQSSALAALGVGASEQQSRMPAPQPKTCTEVERLHLHLPPAAIKAIKVRAAERGVSPSQVVLEAITQVGVL